MEAEVEVGATIGIGVDRHRGADLLRGIVAEVLEDQGRDHVREIDEGEGIRDPVPGHLDE